MQIKNQPLGYRHELKYYLNYADYRVISKRIGALMSRDKNAGPKGEYFIRSLYFDDLEDSAFRDKMSGVDFRDKHRIRIYNLDDGVIKLECKHKEGSYIKKDSISISPDECRRMIKGDYGFLAERDEAFARQLQLKFKLEPMRPRVLVDYMREPYVFPYGNVRVTFDKDIRSAYRMTDIFDPDLPTYPVLPSGIVVLEVKFDEVLPDFIASIVQADAPVRSAVSKYVLCRQFEM
ncbi:MAG: polyphosphate polymerase domain-containing protein [Clostridia bacterium]|nr:polyphosphate polymerase domain-containing protein [Clostridia bacterium]